jgi:hypothetical protein
MAVGLPALMLGTVATLTDPPIAVLRKDTTRCAALAVRDNVDPIEKLGTWAFVLPRLERAYAEVRHSTQGGRIPFGWGSDDQRSECVAALRDLLDRHESVDLFLLAHSNSFHRWVEEIEPEARARIRLVYNSGCWCGGEKEVARWLALGVRAYVAHPGAADHAAFFVPFFRRWIAGVPLARAVDEANQRTDAFFRRLAWIGGDSVVPTMQKWNASRAQIWGERDLDLGSRR